MKESIRKLIKDIYFDNNTNLFIQGCKNKIVFLDDLINKISDYIEKYDVNFFDTEPAEMIRLTVNSKMYHDVHIKYESLLFINKIAKYYYIQHEFSMDNPDEEKISPILDGYSGEAYCKKQFVLDEIIEKYMSEKGYERLDLPEIEEIFLEMIKPAYSDLPEFFSVNSALFMDYYGFFE